MMKMRTRRTLAMTGTAVAFAIVLTGCSAISGLVGGSGDAQRDEATGEVTEGSNIDIFSLKVGDCKMENADGLISDTDVVPCAESHDEEVYYEITMPDGDFSEAAVDEASQECVGQAFTDFVGTAWDDSVLNVYPLTPTQQTWDELDDRVIQCIIYDEAGPVTGSLKGAAR